MKITFIYHSSFAVEMERHFFVFDYFGKGNLNIPKDKKVFFISTHEHGDHFSEKIFDFNADYYILSEDIVADKKENRYFVAPDESLKIEDVEFKFYDSTDEGFFTLVKAEGHALVFAGDHNWWFWDRYSAEERAHMEKWFKGEIDKITDKVDVVFSPVDPRMKDKYHLTGEYYIEKLRPKYFFPMHMWDEYEISEKFKDEMQDKFPFCEIFTINGPGEEFNLK